MPHRGWLRERRWNREFATPFSASLFIRLLRHRIWLPLRQLLLWFRSTAVTTERPQTSFTTDRDQPGTALGDTQDHATRRRRVCTLRHMYPHQFIPPFRLILYPHPQPLTSPPSSLLSPHPHPHFTTSQAARSGLNTLPHLPKAYHVAPPPSRRLPPLIMACHRPRRDRTSQNSIPSTPSICLPQPGPAQSWDGTVPNSCPVLGCVYVYMCIICMYKSV